MDAVYQPSGFNSHYDQDYADYAEYIADRQQVIRKARVDLDQDNAEHIIQVNSPCEYRPPNNTEKFDRAIILIHGFFDSPYILSDVFDHFKSQQQFVRSVLLPGHGTRVGELLETNASDHLQFMDFVIRDTKKHAHKISLVGFSFGAALATMAALQHHEVNNVVMLAPCLRLPNPFSGIAKWLKKLSHPHSKHQWVERNAEIDYVKYQSTPFHAGHQVVQMCREIEEIMQRRRFECPLLMVMSDKDEVVDVATALKFFKQTSRPDNRLILYSGEHSHFEDIRIQQRQQTYSEYNVVDISHRCIPISLQHPYYGLNKEIQDLRHYNSALGGLLRRMNQHKPATYGASTIKNMLKYNLQRLTFNPDFDRLMRDIDAFLGVGVK